MLTIRIALAISLILMTTKSLGEEIQGGISYQGDIVHFELSGKKNWDYDVKKSVKDGKTSFEFAIDPLDSASIKKIQNFKSPIIEKVEVAKNGADGKMSLRFLAVGNEVETFDYLTDQPSRFIIDFYYKDNQAKVEQEEVSKKMALVQKKDPILTLPPKKNSLAKSKRSPATADVMIVGNQGVPLETQPAEPRRLGVFDGGDPDYDRFNIKDIEINENSMIQSRHNFYIEFPRIEVPVLTWEKMRTAGTIYEITPKDSQENKEARLLLALFERKRHAVFLKTLSWFQDKFPNSDYNSILDFAVGDVYLEMWRNDHLENEYTEAVDHYVKAIKNHPDSPLAERISLQLGFLAAEKGDNPLAFRFLNEHLQNQKIGKPGNLSKVVAKLGMAHALTHMSRFKDSIDLLKEIAAQNEHQEQKIEASYKIGDIFSQWAKKTYNPEEKTARYREAIAFYQAALKSFPEKEKEFPGAYFNQGEDYFALKEYKKSLDAHRDFVTRYVANDFSAYSLTRMGELLEILGADTSKIVGAYLEAYFRFGETPHVAIARLRLLSTRMKAMKPKEIDVAIKEITELVEKSDLENIKQFAAMMIAEGYNKRGEFDKSIEYVTNYYKANPTGTDRNVFSEIIEKNYVDKIRTSLENGKFIDALKTHRFFVKTWPYSTNRLDTKYYLGSAFESGGAYKEASKYYQDVLNSVYALKKTEAEKEIRVMQNIPSEDHLNLRLASVANKKGQGKESYQFLRSIREPGKLDAGDQIERVSLAVDLLERKGDLDSSVRYLTELLRTWTGEPRLVAPSYLRLSELEVKRARSDEAIVALVKIDQLQKDSGNVDQKVHARALEKLGDLYLAKNEKVKAQETFESLLEQYEDKSGLPSVRYQLGDIFFKDGKIQKASEVWSKLQEKGGVWYKLSQEKLKDSNWSEEYRKYVKRIPAMAGSKEDTK